MHTHASTRAPFQTVLIASTPAIRESRAQPAAYQAIVMMQDQHVRGGLNLRWAVQLSCVVGRENENKADKVGLIERKNLREAAHRPQFAFTARASFFRVLSPASSPEN